jgi:hypothetical protein
MPGPYKTDPGIWAFLRACNYYLMLCTKLFLSTLGGEVPEGRNMGSQPGKDKPVL